MGQVDPERPVRDWLIQRAVGPRRWRMEGVPRAPRRRSSCYAAARVGLGGSDRPGALL